MMRIGVDCFGLTRPVYTGKEVYIHGLVESLLDPHYDFDLTAIYPSDTVRTPEWSIFGLKMSPSLQLSSYTAWSQVVLPFAVRSCRPDIMVYTESMLPLLNLSRHTRNVVVVYDVMYLRVGDEFDPKTRRLLHTMMPQTLRRADAIVTISKTSKNDLLHFYHVDSSKVHIVYPCVADEFCSQPERLKDSAKAQFGIEGRMISYAGNYHRYKNIKNLLIAFRDLLSTDSTNQPTLVLIGKIDRRTAEIENLVFQLGIQKKVRITGYVTQQEYESLLSASDLLVLPSLYEGFGIPIIEAMTIGTPVAASNVGAMAEVVGENGVLFDPKDTEDITRSMKMVLDNPELSNILRIKGLERAREFRWNRSADVMSKVLNGLS